MICTYEDACGNKYLAIYLAWDEVEAVLGGKKHTGDSEDDKRLISYLRSVGAPEWVNDAKGWTDEKGWGLIGPMLYKYEVIEDNAGGLHLVVFDEQGRVKFYGSGYEHIVEHLQEAIKALKSGDDTSSWDTSGLTLEEMQEYYQCLVGFRHGWAVVADQDGIYPEKMGQAAKIAFGIEPE